MDNGHSPQAGPTRKKRMVDRLNGNVDGLVRVTLGVVQGLVILGLGAVVTMLWSYQGQLGELRSDVRHLTTTVESLEIPPEWFQNDVEGLEERVLELERGRQNE